ncbi:MAG TPA: cache domain-containing protein [Gemmatimonadaceae bacterium]
MSTRSPLPAGSDVPSGATLEQVYEHEDTRELVRLVEDAAELVRIRGEEAFANFRTPDSRWRRGEAYVFVLDPDGRMLVHPDPALEGENELDLKDIGGKPIIRGLIGAATTLPGKPHGWYHYQWPVPGAILPRWKSSYVRLVRSPASRSYIVGSGVYNDRMEKAFVVDLVTNAVGEIEKRGEAAFPLLRDPTGPFLVKDTYVFVTDMAGVELVNPAFPNLEGRDLLDVRDTNGKYLNREMTELVRTRGSGWAEYMWPKPGTSVSTRKSTYVSRAMMGAKPVMVGCGVYLAEAPRAARTAGKMTASELMALVREGAALLEERGENAYPEFRKQGSKWYRGGTYLFVFTMDGTRVFHAAEPASEGENDSALMDILGRPIGRMILDVGATPAGEGWVHYMYPEPGNIFPAWKSTFVKRVTYPSGTPHLVGCGIYNMQMEAPFIEDVVDRAAALIGERGAEAFDQLRDRTGPFVFMDTYVFVMRPDGVELVNPALPWLQGRNLIDLRDLMGKAVIKEEITAAMQDGGTWLECYWYRPGDNTPARKLTYVRKAQAGADTFIVGSGIYVE